MRVTELLARANATSSFCVDNVWYEMSYATMCWIAGQCAPATNRDMVHFIHQNLTKFQLTEHNPTGRALFVYVTRA